MTNLRTALLAVSISAASLMLSVTARADIVLLTQSANQGDVVLFNNTTQTGTTVYGHTQSGTQVAFQGHTNNGGNVISANGGQSRLEGAGGLRLIDLNWHLVGGNTFNNLEFNINTVLNNGPNGGGATAVSFSVFDQSLIEFVFDNNGSNYTLANGQNFFGFEGINGQSISSIFMTFYGGNGVDDVRQVRLDEVTAAVPEPSTWAMMILGFVGVGFLAYRRRGQGQALRLV